MAYITAAERRGMPLSDFGWPEERKFPINSQAHLDAAARLIGRAPAAQRARIKARIIAIARRKGLSLPESWKS